MNPFPWITLVVIGVLGGAWTFGIPTKLEPIEPRSYSIGYKCTEVIQSENVRYVGVPVWKVIPRAKPLPQVSEIDQRVTTRAKTEPKVKKIKACRKGQKIWYYNKSKKRKMFRIRKDC